MAKSQQIFNKLEREKNKAKKREEKRKKMAARREAKAQKNTNEDEFVKVDFNETLLIITPDPS